jgi:hypothetical protein
MDDLDRKINALHADADFQAWCDQQDAARCQDDAKCDPGFTIPFNDEPEAA